MPRVEIEDTATAMQDADDIVRVTKNMEDSFNQLNEFMKQYATSNIRTEWMDQVYNNWQQYQEGDIPETLATMKASAVNIKTAVDEALAYSREEQ